MNPSRRRNRHGFDSIRRMQAADTIRRIVSTDPSFPPGNLVVQLARAARALNVVSGPDRQLLRRWLLRYLQPVLETIDGQEFILEVERQQPTEGTEA